MDLISRQAAIDAAIDAADDWDGGCNKSRDKYITSALIELPSAQPEQRWIPCSKKLPEEGQKCLVSDRGSITADVFLGHGSPYNWAVSVRDYEAWMPLPEPWKGEEDEPDK